MRFVAPVLALLLLTGCGSDAPRDVAAALDDSSPVQEEFTPGTPRDEEPGAAPGLPTAAAMCAAVTPEMAVEATIGGPVGAQYQWEAGDVVDGTTVDNPECRFETGEAVLVSADTASGGSVSEHGQLTLYTWPRTVEEYEAHVEGGRQGLCENDGFTWEQQPVTVAGVPATFSTCTRQSTGEWAQYLPRTNGEVVVDLGENVFIVAAQKPLGQAPDMEQLVGIAEAALEGE